MRRLAALLGLGVFVLAACGSRGEETTKADATTTTTAVKVTTTTTIPTEPA